MTHAAFNDTTFALRLERGENILTTIQDFCAAQSIANAQISGIGSVEDPKLAHYSIETKQFTERQFTGIYEITSLMGNVALIDDQPSAHLHVTISATDMQSFGGHLVQGACSATLELIIAAYPSRHSKHHDDTIGLNVWQF